MSQWIIVCDLTTEGERPVYGPYTDLQAATRHAKQLGDCYYVQPIRPALTDSDLQAMAEVGEECDAMLDAIGNQEEVDPTLSEMAAVLTSHGEWYTGNNVMDEAANWIDHGFSAEDAGEWMDAGFWDAGAANIVRAMGLTPQQAAERAEALADAEEDAAEVYTDGDVIYSICNGDTAASVLADE